MYLAAAASFALTRSRLARRAARTRARAQTRTMYSGCCSYRASDAMRVHVCAQARMSALDVSVHACCVLLMRF